MKLQLFQIDAFTTKVFGGNPAAVVPLTTWLSDDLMQQIAAENNLPETAFYVPTIAGYEIRWFTPTTEVDLCGYATLAAAHVIFKHTDHLDGDTLNMYSKSDYLKVSINKDLYVLNFPSDDLQELCEKEIPYKLEKALNTDIISAHKGKYCYLVELSSQQEIKNLKPNLKYISQLSLRGVIVTAKGENVDFVSRCFFPSLGIDEDPVTGSAHASLTPFWAKKLGKKELTAVQLSARKGNLVCKYLDDRVEIGGYAKTYLEGEIEV